LDTSSFYSYLSSSIALVLEQTTGIRNTEEPRGNSGNIKKKERNQRKGTTEISPYLHWEDDYTMARRVASWLEFQFTGEDSLASCEIVGACYKKL
jgi:hypothetical protein